jgi:hypothetical protein
MEDSDAARGQDAPPRHPARSRPVPPGWGGRGRGRRRTPEAAPEAGAGGCPPGLRDASAHAVAVTAAVTRSESQARRRRADSEAGPEPVTVSGRAGLTRKQGRKAPSPVSGPARLT